MSPSHPQHCRTLPILALKRLMSQRPWPTRKFRCSAPTFCPIVSCTVILRCWVSKVHGPLLSLKPGGHLQDILPIESNEAENCHLRDYPTVFTNVHRNIACQNSRNTAVKLFPYFSAFMQYSAWRRRTARRQFPCTVAHSWWRTISTHVQSLLSPWPWHLPFFFASTIFPLYYSTQQILPFIYHSTAVLSDLYLPYML